MTFIADAMVTPSRDLNLKGARIPTMVERVAVLQYWYCGEILNLSCSKGC